MSLPGLSTDNAPTWSANPPASPGAAMPDLSGADPSAGSGFGAAAPAPGTQPNTVVVYPSGSGSSFGGGDVSDAASSGGAPAGTGATAPSAASTPNNLPNGPNVQSAGAAAPASSAPGGTQRSVGDQLTRQLGLTGRLLLQGPAQLFDAANNLANGAANVAVSGINGVFGTDIPKFSYNVASQLADQAANNLGLPQPETPVERAIQTTGSFAVGAMLPSGIAAAAAKLSELVPVALDDAFAELQSAPPVKPAGTATELSGTGTDSGIPAAAPDATVASGKPGTNVTLNPAPAPAPATPAPTPSGILAVENLPPVSPATSGGVSATKMSSNGVSILVTNPADQALAQNVINNGDPAGTVTEALVSSVAKQDGVVELTGGKYGSNNGFDHVFQNPDGTVTIIMDSKQLPNGAASLSTDGAGETTQLSDAWVQAVLPKLDQTSPAAQAITQAIQNGTLIKGLIGVDRGSGNLLMIRVK